MILHSRYAIEQKKKDKTCDWIFPLPIKESEPRHSKAIHTKEEREEKLAEMIKERKIEIEKLKQGG